MLMINKKKLFLNTKKGNFKKCIDYRIIICNRYANIGTLFIKNESV